MDLLYPLGRQETIKPVEIPEKKIEIEMAPKN